MAIVDRLTLVELIEAEKAKLTAEALELWEEFDTSMYLSSEDDTTFKPHERDMIRRMAYLPTADQHVIERTRLRGRCILGSPHIPGPTPKYVPDPIYRPYEEPPARICLAGRRGEMEEVDLDDLLSIVDQTEELSRTTSNLGDC